MIYAKFNQINIDLNLIKIIMRIKKIKINKLLQFFNKKEIYQLILTVFILKLYKILILLQRK